MQYLALQIVWLVVCLFMHRCCFNCRSTPHPGQNHNLHLSIVQLSSFPKADKFRVGKDKNEPVPVAERSKA